MTRETPVIGKKPRVDSRLRVTRDEVLSFLSSRGLPDTLQFRKRARNRLKKKKERSLLPRGREISLSETDAPQSIVYGEARVGGVIVFAHVTNNNLRLHYIVALAGHEIESIEQVYVNDNRIAWISTPEPRTIQRWAGAGIKPDGTEINYLNRVFVGGNVGTDSQTVQPDAFGQIPTFWTAEHRMRGTAHAYVQLVWNAAVFGDGGGPTISFEIKGKRVFDPRTGTTAYSANAALCIRDFLLDTKHGLGTVLSSTALDEESWILAANICDESVNLKGGGTEPRYQLGIHVDSEAPRIDVLEEMLGACMGRLFWSQGKLKIVVGAWREPVVELTPSDFRSELSYSEFTDSADIFNSVRGKFVSKAEGFKVIDFPSLSSATHIAEDGGRVLWAEVDFPTVISSAHAQRLAALGLKAARYQRQLAVALGFKGYELEIGDVVLLTVPFLNLNQVAFEVDDIEMRIEREGEIIFDVVLLETNEAVFFWDPDSEENTLATPPNLDLPDPTVVGPPSNLTLESGTAHLYLKADGTVMSRIFVQWDPPDDSFVLDGGSIELQFRRQGAATWQNEGLLEGESTNHYLFDVEDGIIYQVRIRSVNALGVKGAWIGPVAQVVVGKTEPPSDVSSLSFVVDESGIRFNWTEIPDLDRWEYELRRGASWDSSTLIARLSANEYFWNFQTAGTYNVMIKAIDSSGNYSVNARAVSVEIAGPGAVQNLRADTIDTQVLLFWDEPLTSPLPVVEYEVRKGAVYASASVLGTVGGTFGAFFEISSGTQTYWVAAKDAAGNLGPESSVELELTLPAGFEVITNETFETWDSFTNAFKDDECLFGPVDTTQTFATHFSGNSWSSFADKAAAVTYFIEPGAATGSAVKEIDLGTIVKSVVLNFDYTKSNLGPDRAFRFDVDYSDDGVSYTTITDAEGAFIPSARYIEVTLQMGLSDGELGVLCFEDISLRINVKTIVDGGTVAVLAADSGGTTVTFERDFSDVQSITATPQGTTSALAVVDFTDVPNPVSFKILLFDLATGNRLDGNVAWQAKGST
jgi:hypothetical protein